jgi:hypothetical protein
MFSLEGSYWGGGGGVIDPKKKKKILNKTNLKKFLKKKLK